MSMTTVKGTYKDGKVELSEKPPEVGNTADVLVTFLPANGADVSAGRLREESEEKEARRQRAIAQMEEGIPLGGPPYPKREELYDRFDR